MYNHKPSLPGHSLLIPKRHVETVLDFNDSELAELGPLMKRMASMLMNAYNGTGVDFSIQNGFVAGASIAHLHIHVVPRRAGDIDGDPSLWMAKILEAERTKKPISASEMQSNVKKIRNAINGKK